MNILSEIVGEHILSLNEQNKDKPMPENAFCSLEQLRDFVNANQTSLDPNFHLPAYYKMIPDTGCTYLRDVVLPKTAATVFQVLVPPDAATSMINTLFVPPFESAVREPTYPSMPEKIKQDRELAMPNCVIVWQPGYNDPSELNIDYDIVESLGIIPDRRSSDWALFPDRASAEAYLQIIKDRPSVPCPMADLFEYLFDDFYDPLDFDYEE